MKVSENVALRTKVTFNTKFDTYADPIYNEMFIGIGQKKSDTMWDEEKSGYEVIPFYNGTDAIKNINIKAHLWILDIMLPDEISGYDIIKKI